MLYVAHSLYLFSVFIHRTIIINLRLQNSCIVPLTDRFLNYKCIIFPVSNKNRSLEKRNKIQFTGKENNSPNSEIEKYLQTPKPHRAPSQDKHFMKIDSNVNVLRGFSPHVHTCAGTHTLRWQRFIIDLYLIRWACPTLVSQHVWYTLTNVLHRKWSTTLTSRLEIDIPRVSANGRDGSVGVQTWGHKMAFFYAL